MNLPDIQKVKSLRGKKVLLRSDLNVSFIDGEIGSKFRLNRALETIKFLNKEGAKIILISHIGKDETISLKPVYEFLKDDMEVNFIDGVLGQETLVAVESMNDGDIVMLENLRRDDGEISNDKNFAEKLSSLADIYVNDAFSASHREHASIVGVPQFLPSYAGILFQEEVEELSKALEPQHPSILVLGGAKIETKLPLIRKFLNIYDKVFVGGVLANTFFKEKGCDVGMSVVDGGGVDIKDLLTNNKLVFPVDVVVKNEEGSVVKKPSEVSGQEKIVDEGPETVEKIGQIIKNCKMVVWNGPLGEYERGFADQTKSLAKLISDSGAYSIVGGGDTITAIEELGIMDKISFTSTGGGAMLIFLLNGTLPGIEILQKSITPK